MRQVHLPVWMGNLSRPTATALSLLFALAAMLARALLITWLPVEAYRQLGDAGLVSLLYFCASLVGLATSSPSPGLSVCSAGAGCSRSAPAACSGSR